ncbi:MAG: anthranilate synthase component I [Nitrospirota bacterium]
MIVPSFELFSEKAKEGNLIPVYQEILADTETPVSAFLKIKESPYSYLFESVEGGEKWGRYSFLGTNPAIIIKGFGNTVEVIKKGQRSVFHGGASAAESPLDLLKKIMAKFKPVSLPDLPRFSGGAIGFIGYEGARFFDAITFKPKKEATPDLDFFFMIADTLIIFDNLKQKMKIVVNVSIENENLKEAYEAAVLKIKVIVERLRSPLNQSHPFLSPDKKQSALPQSNMSKEQFLTAVSAAKELIAAGDIFQVQISQRFSVPLQSDPFLIYRSLRRVNPSPYMYYIEIASLYIVGTSPEVLVRLENGLSEIRPIAGTRRRGRTDKEDQAMEAELLSDPKEAAEHIMLVDLGRNDLGRVCDYGSVKVTDLMVIERYSHVMHIVSHVVGQLKKTHDAYDLLKASFPAGTVTGAPKIRAMQIIDTLEPQSRGLYAGTVGYIGFDGNMDTCITIRTIVIDKNVATVQAAAGIVADSDPELEYKETLNKAKAMLTAIEMAEQGLI